MNCLIIAAGRGSRLSETGLPKPLVQINRISLISYIIQNVASIGINNFTVVTGYENAKIEEELHNINRQVNININIVFNPDWNEGNGLSVLSAKKFIKAPFVLLMSDHLFDPQMLTQLLSAKLQENQTLLAIDTQITNNPQVDLEDVTRVKFHQDKIIDIGKHIEDYNAFDTGMFYSSDNLFNALERSISQGDTSLSGGMRILIEENNAKVYPVNDAMWIDVDTSEMLERAKKLLKNGQLPVISIPK